MRKESLKNRSHAFKARSTHEALAVPSSALYFASQSHYDQRIDHVPGAPLHPQTQGEIEPWHQTLKNRILLQNYYLPGDLQARIGDFVAHYNPRRYHESIANLAPADVYFGGRGQTILLEREKDQTTDHPNRRLQHHAA